MYKKTQRFRVVVCLYEIMYSQVYLQYKNIILNVCNDDADDLLLATLL
jgi:hypothetical protein